MGAPWNLAEARLVQERLVTSAANALQVSLGNAVPEGKVWIITACSYMPSVAETKIVSFEKVSKTVNTFGILNPVSLALNPASATFLEQGMEHMLFPSEYLLARRDSATAGSTMSLRVQYIEIDLPLYTYAEPQIVKRQDRVLSSIRSRLGGGVGGVGLRGATGLVEGPSRRGGPLEK